MLILMKFDRKYAQSGNPIVNLFSVKLSSLQKLLHFLIKLYRVPGGTHSLKR